MGLKQPPVWGQSSKEDPKGVPHVWHVDDIGHDAAHWRKSLCLFAQHVFKQSLHFHLAAAERNARQSWPAGDDD